MYLVINLSPVIINSMCYANGSGADFKTRVRKHPVYELLEALKFSTYFLLQQLWRKQTNFSEEKMISAMFYGNL